MIPVSSHFLSIWSLLVSQCSLHAEFQASKKYHHNKKQENTSEVVLWPLHACSHMCTHGHIYMCTYANPTNWEAKKPSGR